jgi:hypothetical protein
MTSPSQDPASARPSGKAGELPASRGWITVHAMEPQRDASLRFPLELARAAAEGLRKPPFLKTEAETDAPWDAFTKPFRTARENLDRIREPMQSMKPAVEKAAPQPAGQTSDRNPLRGIGALAGTGLAGLDLGEIGKASAKPPAPRAASAMGGIANLPAAGLGGLGLAAIGAAASSAVNGAGPLFAKPSAHGAGADGKTGGDRNAKPADGSWVETGNPTTQPARASRRTGAAAKSALAAGIAHPMSPRLPAAPSPLEAWAEKAARKLKDYARGAGQAPAKTAGAAGASMSGPVDPMSPRRAPFIPPDDPETLARFKRVLESLPPEPGSPATGEPAGSGVGGNTVTPVSRKDPERGAERVPADPGLSDVLDRLYGPSVPAPSPESGDGDVFSPVQPPLPYRDAGAASPAAPAPAAASRPAPAAPADASTGTPNRSRAASEIEWLEEEDDLAAKLHSLLRRQAKRRGVDLA